MAGSQDFANSFLPQQPINSFMFQKLTQCESINLVTNPHRFTMAQGLEFLGISGQAVHDMQLFCKMRDQSPLACMKMLLEIRHLCPSAPDTLRAHQFRDFDPFIIPTQGPDVFFSGCQSQYQEQVILQDSKFKNTAVKLISVPTFALTKSIVLMDLQTLQSYELKFDQPCEKMEE